MQNEIYWLTLTLLVTALMWMPYILDLLFKNRILDPILKPYTADLKPISPWAERAKAAHKNSVENLVIFAPLVVVCYLLRGQINSDAVTTAAMIYLVSRILHYLVYVFRLPVLRTVFFFVGFGVNIFLALQILGALAG